MQYRLALMRQPLFLKEIRIMKISAVPTCSILPDTSKFFFITPWINHLKGPYINALILSYQNKALMFRFPGAVTLDTISHFPALLRIYDQARIR